MECDKQAEIQRQLDLLREELERAPTQEMKAKEEALFRALKDHLISHNSGLTENCKKK